MKTKNIILGIVSASLLLFSCSSGPLKKKFQKNIALLCLKENDTLYVRVTNHSDSIIYVPKEYAGDYTNNDDTLHLETINKPEYSTTYYYRYKNVLPFEFYTTRSIEGFEADSIEKYTKQTYFFNQFRLQPILPILPDSSYIVTLIFNVPKYANVVKAVFYNRSFLTKERLDKFDYGLDDFVKFDSSNAEYITAPIIIRYH